MLPARVQIRAMRPLAEPSFVVDNPTNGHAHYVYLLRCATLPLLVPSAK
jgi:hypothetical protein